MRNAKPIELHILEGNPDRLSRAQIEERIENEIRFGDKNFTPSKLIKKDRVAFKKWKEIVDLYSGLDFVTTSDQDLIENYCMTHSEKIRLLSIKNEALNQCNSKGADCVQAYKALDVLGIEEKIDRKTALLIKMERELILTPVSKINRIARNKKKPVENPLSKQMFGD